ncbi:MAG TPA: arginine deiminase family protein [Pyrinomonadaceae bacterium]|jgi:dimethylargininase|nr:arginine deiminase family protein [Pyrinomonadaceae bacterium]
MFTRAIVRPPGPNFAAGLTRHDSGVPNYERALGQHAAYCDALEQCGLELTRLEADERFPDSTFVEDTAVIISAVEGNSASSKATVVILTRPGAPSRAGEVENIRNALSQFRPQFHSIVAPGTLDGGDICEAGTHLFIGVSERTNESGAQQLSDFLAALGFTSSIVDIRDTQNILHLKSGLAYLGDNRLVVIDPLTKRQEFRGYELVRVSAAEEYAANCVRVNDYVLVAAGNPEFERTLRKLNYQTIALEMTEFQKMDGGLSCLSLRF